MAKTRSVADGWYVYWDDRGLRHLLAPGDRMPLAVLDIVGDYSTRAAAEEAADRRIVGEPAETRAPHAAAR